MKIIVIGAGIAGLSTAIALRRAGFEPEVFERASAFREVGAGISIWANALRALDAMGAGAAVRAKSACMTVSEIRLSRGRKTILRNSAAELARRTGLDEQVRMMHRADLIEALASCLPSGVVQTAHECVSIREYRDLMAVRFADGSSRQANLVIGADGLRSVVRQYVVGNAAPRYSGYTCMRGICPRPKQLESGYVGEWWGRGLRFGITTLPDDRIYWFAVENAPVGRRIENISQHLKRTYADWAEPVPELIASTPHDHIIHGDIFDRDPDDHWYKGPCLLIGDAAHPTTPNLGQGGCMAIEDAVVLARCLGSNDLLESNLKQFTAERFPRTRSITLASRSLGRTGQMSGLVSCFVRDRLLSLVAPMMGAGSLLKNAMFDVGPIPQRKTED